MLPDSAVLEKNQLQNRWRAERLPLPGRGLRLEKWAAELLFREISTGLPG